MHAVTLGVGPGNSRHVHNEGRFYEGMSGDTTRREGPLQCEGSIGTTGKSVVITSSDPSGLDP
jgi:hypothetical protein